MIRVQCDNCKKYDDECSSVYSYRVERAKVDITEKQRRSRNMKNLSDYRDLCDACAAELFKIFAPGEWQK